jgi:hypothetical protein
MVPSLPHRLALDCVSPTSSLMPPATFPRADSYGRLRGFAAVFAEDVPEVSENVVPTSTSTRMPICSCIRRLMETYFHFSTLG